MPHSLMAQDRQHHGLTGNLPTRVQSPTEASRKRTDMQRESHSPADEPGAALKLAGLTPLSFAAAPGFVAVFSVSSSMPVGGCRYSASASSQRSCGKKQHASKKSVNGHEHECVHCQSWCCCSPAEVVRRRDCSPKGDYWAVETTLAGAFA